MTNDSPGRTRGSGSTRGLQYEGQHHLLLLFAPHSVLMYRSHTQKLTTSDLMPPTSAKALQQGTSCLLSPRHRIRTPHDVRGAQTHLAAVGEDDNKAAVQGAVVELCQLPQLQINFLYKKHHALNWPQMTGKPCPIRPSCISAAFCPVKV